MKAATPPFLFSHDPSTPDGQQFAVFWLIKDVLIAQGRLSNQLIDESALTELATKKSNELKTWIKNDPELLKEFGALAAAIGLPQFTVALEASGHPPTPMHRLSQLPMFDAHPEAPRPLSIIEMAAWLSTSQAMESFPDHLHLPAHLSSAPLNFLNPALSGLVKWSKPHWPIAPSQSDQDRWTDWSSRFLTDRIWSYQVTPSRPVPDLVESLSHLTALSITLSPKAHRDAVHILKNFMVSGRKDQHQNLSNSNASDHPSDKELDIQAFRRQILNDKIALLDAFLNAGLPAFIGAPLYGLAIKIVMDNHGLECSYSNEQNQKNQHQKNDDVMSAWKQLKSKNVPLDHQNIPHLASPLSYAIVHGDPDLLQKMMSFGFDPLEPRADPVDIWRAFSIVENVNDQQRAAEVLDHLPPEIFTAPPFVITPLTSQKLAHLVVEKLNAPLLKKALSVYPHLTLTDQDTTSLLRFFETRLSLPDHPERLRLVVQVMDELGLDLKSHATSILAAAIETKDLDLCSRMIDLGALDDNSPKRASMAQKIIETFQPPDASLFSNFSDQNDQQKHVSQDDLDHAQKKRVKMFSDIAQKIPPHLSLPTLRGETLLHVAMATWNIEAVGAFLKFGVNFETPNAYGDWPTQSPSFAPSSRRIHQLLAQRDPGDPVVMAMLSMLAEHGVDFDRVNPHNQTPHFEKMRLAPSFAQSLACVHTQKILNQAIDQTQSQSRPAKKM